MHARSSIDRSSPESSLGRLLGTLGLAFLLTGAGPLALGAQEAGDSTAADTTAAESAVAAPEEAPADTQVTPEEPPGAPSPPRTRIMISDDAIQVKQLDDEGKENEVFRLDVDKDALRKRIEEAVSAISEGVGEGLGELGERGRPDYEQVGKDVVKIAGNFELEDDEMIRGDVVILFGDLLLKGRVTGDVTVVGGTIDLGPRSWVNGDLAVVFGNLNETKSSQVDGETITIGSLGSPGFVFPAFPWYGPVVGGGPVVRFVVMSVIKAIVLFILALIIYMFLKDRLVLSKENLQGHGIRCLGIGLVVTVLGSLSVAAVVFVLSITLIGIPLALLVVFAVGLILVVSYLVAALGLADFLARRLHVGIVSPFLLILVGLVLLEIFNLSGQFFMQGSFLRPLGFSLHLIGFMVKLLALMMGLGALVVSRFGNRAPPEAMAAAEA
jgi:hypothetical protein